MRFDDRGITKKLRDSGYPDRDVLVYNRLGPKARAVIYNSPKKVDLTGDLKEFHIQRERPDPIEIDGELYPQPLPSVYQSEDGDSELAAWLVRKHYPPKSREEVKREVAEMLATYPSRKVDLDPAGDVGSPRERGRDLDI